MNKPRPADAVQDVKFIDLQLAVTPEGVDNEVRDLWATYELGNDNCIVKWNADEMKEDYPNIAIFLHEAGLTDDDDIILHWWW